jgi:hypothetical protein
MTARETRHASAGLPERVLRYSASEQPVVFAAQVGGSSQAAAQCSAGRYSVWRQLEGSSAAAHAVGRLGLQEERRELVRGEAPMTGPVCELPRAAEEAVSVCQESA